MFTSFTLVEIMYAVDRVACIIRPAPLLRPLKIF